MRELTPGAGSPRALSGSGPGSPTGTADRIRLLVLDCLAAIVLTLAWPALAASSAGAAYELDRQWGSEGSGDGQFDFIQDVAVDPVLEHVFVADSGNDRIQRFDSRGTFLGRWGSRGPGDGQSIDRGGGGLERRSDLRHRLVQRAGPGVQPHRHVPAQVWGSDGSGDGQFRVSVGIAVNAFGDVIVTDGEDSSGANHRERARSAPG